jgi:hypothetical protein
VPITEQYGAQYSVTLNTGETQYYHIVFEPNPQTTFFSVVRVPAGTQVVSYTMSGWGPVGNGIANEHPNLSTVPISAHE